MCDGDGDLSVGICENGYPFAHIPTHKWQMGLIIAFSSTQSALMDPLSFISKYIWKGGTKNLQLWSRWINWDVSLNTVPITQVYMILFQ